MQPTGRTYSKGPSISAEADKNSRSPSPQITTDRTTRAAEMSQKDGDTGVDPSQASSNNNPVFQVGGATLAQRSSFLIEDILFQRPKVIPSRIILIVVRVQTNFVTLKCSYGYHCFLFCSSLVISRIMRAIQWPHPPHRLLPPQ